MLLYNYLRFVQKMGRKVLKIYEVSECFVYVASSRERDTEEKTTHLF